MFVRQALYQLSPIPGPWLSFCICWPLLMSPTHPSSQATDSQHLVYSFSVCGNHRRQTCTPPLHTVTRLPHPRQPCTPRCTSCFPDLYPLLPSPIHSLQISQRNISRINTLIHLPRGHWWLLDVLWNPDPRGLSPWRETFALEVHLMAAEVGTEEVRRKDFYTTES